MRLATCALLALVSTVLHGAEVFRSTDANGNANYSDRPQGNDAVPVFIATPRPATPAPTAPQRANSRATAATTAAEQPAAAAEPAEATAEERAKNCSIARERLQTYTVSHRLYRTTESGEREYLNDGEIDEARARAAADVETWCD